MPLKNLILACLEKSLSRICGLSFCLSQVIGVWNAIWLKISMKKKCFLIHFQQPITFWYIFKNLTIYFSIQPTKSSGHHQKLRAWNWVHKLELMVKLSQNFNFTHKKITKNIKLSKKKEIRPSNFQDFLFSMSSVNGENLQEFKIFDLTSIGRPTMEWPWTDL